MRALKLARVSYSPVRAYEIGAALGTWAARFPSFQGSSERGPGLDQDCAATFAVHLTVLRGICKAGTTNPQQVAWWNSRGAFLGIRTWRRGMRTDDTQAQWLPIYGAESPQKPRFGSGQLGPAWPRDLELALGTVLLGIQRAEQGPSVLPEYAIPTTQNTPLATLLVAGPAVSIMQKPVVWRYLNASFVETIGYVGAAAAAFETRLRAMEGSGVEIPPTPIELAAAERVRSTARVRYNRDLLIGGGTLGGGAIATTLLSIVRNRATA